MSSRENIAVRLVQVGEQKPERTITSIFLNCLPSEIDHEVKMLQGMTKYARVDLKRPIGAKQVVIRHNRRSRENALVARARNNPSRSVMDRNGTGVGNGAVHTPQVNEKQDNSEETRGCHTC